MTHRLVVLPEAEKELREALHGYEERRSRLGAELFGVVEASMVHAASSPLGWPTWELDGRYRRIAMKRFPYVLFYEIRGHSVEFVAVAHTRREPGYWLGRVTRPEEGP